MNLILPRAIGLARWVLTWFVLSLAVAVASPWVKPQAMQWVCSSASTLKLLVQAEDGSAPLAHIGWDCPLCAAPAAPPPALQSALGWPSPGVLRVSHTAAPHTAWGAAAPLPARGPPTHS